MGQGSCKGTETGASQQRCRGTRPEFCRFAAASGHSLSSHCPSPHPRPSTPPAADSIEDQILKLQDRKRATIAQALQEGSGAGGLAAFSSRLTQQELHELFDDVARAR